MLRILLVILVALAVIIGLMTISGGKNRTSAPGAATPAAQDQSIGAGSDSTPAAQPEGEAPVDTITDVYGEEPTEAGAAPAVEEALPEDLSEDDLSSAEAGAAEAAPAEEEGPNN